MKPLSITDPREFLKLPREERQRLLSEQANEVANFYQPGNPHIEWTEEYNSGAYSNYSNQRNQLE
jgi:hypothetical protein